MNWKPSQRYPNRHVAMTPFGPYYATKWWWEGPGGFGKEKGLRANERAAESSYKKGLQDGRCEI